MISDIEFNLGMIGDINFGMIDVIDSGIIGDVNFDFDFGVIGPLTFTLVCLGHRLQLWRDRAIDFGFGMVGNIDFDFGMIGNVDFDFGIIGPPTLTSA